MGSYFDGDDDVSTGNNVVKIEELRQPQQEIDKCTTGKFDEQLSLLVGSAGSAPAASTHLPAGEPFKFHSMGKVVGYLADKTFQAERTSSGSKPNK